MAFFRHMKAFSSKSLGCGATNMVDYFNLFLKLCFQGLDFAAFMKMKMYK